MVIFEFEKIVAFDCFCRELYNEHGYPNNNFQERKQNNKTKEEKFEIYNYSVFIKKIHKNFANFLKLDFSRVKYLITISNFTEALSKTNLAGTGVQKYTLKRFNFNMLHTKCWCRYIQNKSNVFN